MTEPTPQSAWRAAANRHLAPGDEARLAANGYQGMAAPDPAWAALHAEAAAVMAGGDPASPAAMDLARRWMEQVFAATGGDPALTRRVHATARAAHADPAVAAIAPEGLAMMDFIRQAYGAAIAAGIMPRPEV